MLWGNTTQVRDHRKEATTKDNLTIFIDKEMQVVVEHRRPPTAGAVGSSGLGLGTPRRKGGARPAPARGPAGTHSHTQLAHGRTLTQAPGAISEKYTLTIKKTLRKGQGLVAPAPGFTGTSNGWHTASPVTAPVSQKERAPLPFWGRWSSRSAGARRQVP